MTDHQYIKLFLIRKVISCVYFIVEYKLKIGIHKI